MWIGILVAVLVTGETHTDAMLFKSEAECREPSVVLEKMMKETPQVLAYKIDCLDVEKTMVIKKSKAPVPSAAPGPKTESL